MLMLLDIFLDLERLNIHYIIKKYILLIYESIINIYICVTFVLEQNFYCN